MNHDLLTYGTSALVIINIIINLKIFARSSELKDLELRMTEKFVTKKTYDDNHNKLENHVVQIQQDLSDLKSLLITAIAELKSNVKL